MNILLNMTLSGALLVAVIVVIRILAMHRLPKRAFIVLWFIALFQLVVPFSIPSQMSIFNLFDASSPIQQVTTPPDMSSTPNIAVSDFQRQVYGYFPVLNTPRETVTTYNRLILEPLVSVYLIGVIISAILFTLLYNKHRKDFDDAQPFSNALITDWLASHKLKRKMSIRVSHKIAAPLTYGIFRPVILLPEDTNWDNLNELNYVLAHEFIHIKRFDAFTKLVMTAVLCVHWFNPFAWCMYFLFNRDLEISCDEAVVHMLGEQSKQGYALTLIGMIERKNHFPTLYNNFAKYAIEERITAIMKMKKRTILGTLAALLVVGVTATVFATSRANEPATLSTNYNAVTLEEMGMYHAVPSELPTNLSEDSSVELPENASKDLHENDDCQNNWFLWPLESYTRIASHFGLRSNPVTERAEFHTGIDIPAPMGTPILTVMDGTVIFAEFYEGFGNTVIIYHGGYSTVYAHASAIHVEEGQLVRQGEHIADVGATGVAAGPHLHFEIRVGNHAIDPLPFFAGFENQIAHDSGGDGYVIQPVPDTIREHLSREFPVYTIDYVAQNIQFFMHHTYHEGSTLVSHQISFEDAAIIAADAVYENHGFNIGGMTGYMHFNNWSGQTRTPFWMGFILCEERTAHAMGDELFHFEICANTGDILLLNKNTVENPFIG